MADGTFRGICGDLRWMPVDQNQKRHRGICFASGIHQPQGTESLCVYQCRGLWSRQFLSRTLLHPMISPPGAECDLNGNKSSMRGWVSKQKAGKEETFLSAMQQDSPCVKSSFALKLTHLSFMTTHVIHPTPSPSSISTTLFLHALHGPQNEACGSFATAEWGPRTSWTTLLLLSDTHRGEKP